MVRPWSTTPCSNASARGPALSRPRASSTLLVTRGAYGRWAGLSEDKLKHPVHTERAPALVAADCIAGVPERVDYRDAIVLSPSTKWRPSARCGILSKPAKWKRSPFRSCRRTTHGARTAGEAHPDPHRTRHLLHPVERHRAGAGRIRTHVHHRHQCLCRARRARDYGPTSNTFSPTAAMTGRSW